MERKKYLSITLFLLVLIGSILMLYPLLWMLSSSFKPESMIFTDIGIWPKQVTIENYIKGWEGISGISFGKMFNNSFVVVIFSVLGNLISCTLTAYAFARLDFAFKKILFAAMLLTMMLPNHVVLIPQYMLFSNIGWIDKYYPLFVPKFFATDAFFIFLMVQFIRGIPRDLDQAATVDGCSPVKIFIRIILPLIQPALVTTTIFTFIWTWNDFFSQLIYINNPTKFTVSLGLRTFLDATARSSFGAVFAMSIVSLIPIFILFVSFQRLIIEGIATTGLK